MIWKESFKRLPLKWISLIVYRVLLGSTENRLHKINYHIMEKKNCLEKKKEQIIKGKRSFLKEISITQWFTLYFLPKMKCEVLLFYSECMCKKNMCVCIYIYTIIITVIGGEVKVAILFSFQVGPHAETCFSWSGKWQWVYNPYYKHFRAATWSPSPPHLLHGTAAFQCCKHSVESTVR